MSWQKSMTGNLPTQYSTFIGPMTSFKMADEIPRNLMAWFPASYRILSLFKLTPRRSPDVPLILSTALFDLIYWPMGDAVEILN